MRNGALIVFALVVSTSALALTERAVDDSWMMKRQIIVSATVISVDPIGSREVPDVPIGQPGTWLFPHARAQFAVSEVLQNLTTRALAAGDTISALLVTDNTASSPDNAELAVVVFDWFPPNDLRPGLQGIFFVDLRDGDLWCSTRAWEEKTVVEALEKFDRGPAEDAASVGVR